MSNIATMRHDRCARLALSVGEPAGIGPDIVIAMAGSDFDAHIVCIADPATLAARAALLQSPLEILEISSEATIPRHQPGRLVVLPVATSVEVIPGVLDTRNARYVLDCLDVAIALARAHSVDAIVTGPVHKGIINDAGFGFTGHTEYLALDSDLARPVMMLASGSLRIALVTTHMALSEVPSALNSAHITYIINVVATALRRQFNIPHPRIGVCGLNPHAGESGHFGHEDAELITPAIDAARSEHVTLIGPMPADTAFAPETRRSIDAYVTMYHDQGLPVIKALGFGEIVNITLGLPLLRTSVDHGTAIDIAGMGSANPGSLIAAVAAAIELSAKLP
ncbi:MAG: 4-hydroxythreonine-4-phosphate dehydrogenase [Gammaproteobacteria bacterium]|jgi:4-hydroxythreonine-4-phosphate dehydrogenase